VLDAVCSHRAAALMFGGTEYEVRLTCVLVAVLAGHLTQAQHRGGHI
jgi:hypothetical protein